MENELNRKIFHWLNPGACWHDPYHSGSALGPVVRCRNCTTVWLPKDSPDNPSYTTDPAAFFELVEAVRGKGYRFLMTEYEVGPERGKTTLYCLLSRDAPSSVSYRGDAESLPMALCLAVGQLIEKGE